ncbi:MAG: hypothetical protein H7839_04730 [Magnetococcus sp. YQC-5]
MPKEKRCMSNTCETIASAINTRIEYMYQRQAKLTARMDELERSTHGRLEQVLTQMIPQMEQLTKQQTILMKMATEQEEESAAIFANQNQLLLSLQESLSDIHGKLKQLSDRQDATLRRVAVLNEPG